MPQVQIEDVDLALVEKWCRTQGEAWKVIDTSDSARTGGTAAVYRINSPKGLLALKLYSEKFSSGKRGRESLGRFVARELGRSFDLAEAPNSDISVMEAVALVDKDLSDPLVHLKLKQSRVASVSLVPGVNLQVPFAEQSELPSSAKKQRISDQTTPAAQSDPWALIADALAPYLLKRLTNNPSLVQEKTSEYKPRQNRKVPQKKLL